ncbi:LysR family transcriptional regulator [Fluviispira vulneris]|uniref:LysR family transcriptional regulator n=1 Tax=Fluviispira vulneris TaxID=2763012 RepID=UPI001647B8E8|nr:LysR family transcriptional regulator [Fluviispira vulneris]
MDNFIKNINIFIEVAKYNSFTKAAMNLNMPKSYVSLGIKKLEEQVGARLFFRTTRQIHLTYEGKEYYDRCLSLLFQLNEVENLFKKDKNKIKGHLKISIPSRIARVILIPNLPKFFSNFPEIKLSLCSTDCYVNLIQDGYDCVVRVGDLKDSSYISKSIGELKIINCASVGYINQFGKAESIADLSKHYIINYASSDSQSPSFEYFFNEKTYQVKMKSLLTVNNAESYISAAVSDLGIIQIPEYDVRNLIEKNILYKILENYQAQSMPIAFLYPHRKHIIKPLNVFMEWFKELIHSFCIN